MSQISENRPEGKPRRRWVDNIERKDRNLGWREYRRNGTHIRLDESECLSRFWALELGVADEGKEKLV